MIDLTHLTPAHYTTTSAEDDPRLGNLIKDSSGLPNADIVIFGVPTNDGIARNGGRIGAAEAPQKIREFLAKLTPFGGAAFKDHLNSLSIVDLGDVSGATLEEMHDRARSLVYELMLLGKSVVALGGGHDVTYPLASGFSLAYRDKQVGLVNIDAHLDVRPKKNGQHHSGSSFRLLLEENIINGQNFCEIGIQSFAAAKSHWDWVVQQGAMVLTFEDTTTDGLTHAFESALFHVTKSDLSNPVYLSFDIDSVRSSDAPGCSAPSPFGYLAEEAYELAVAAGLSQSVRMLDIVEMNPRFDQDDRTARLCARMIAGYMIGIANRKHKK